jgi:hypothetical protein
LARLEWRILLKSVRLPLQEGVSIWHTCRAKSVELVRSIALHILHAGIFLLDANDNPNTTQTLEYTKDKYNANIMK